MTTTRSWSGERPNDSGRRACRPSACAARGRATPAARRRVCGGEHEERDRVDRHQRARRSTGRCTPFWPPSLDEAVRGRRSCRTRACTPRSWRRSAAASPTCAITTPISPAGTCTHGNFFTAKSGQSLNRSPGMSSVGLVAGLAVERDRVVLARACGTRTRFVTSPTSAGPIEWNDFKTTRRSAPPRRSRRSVHPCRSLLAHARWVCPNPTPSGRPRYRGCMAAPTPAIVNRRAARLLHRRDIRMRDRTRQGQGEIDPRRQGQPAQRLRPRRAPRSSLYACTSRHPPSPRRTRNPSEAGSCCSTSRDRRARGGERAEGDHARSAALYFRPRVEDRAQRRPGPAAYDSAGPGRRHQAGTGGRQRRIRD